MPPADNAIVAMEKLAERLSQEDPGETYVLHQPLTNNTAPAFITNSSDVMPGRWSTSYFINGQQAMNGHELLTGMF